MSGWVLHPGDCLDPTSGLASLADRSVEHGLLDPPYSEHVHTNGRAGRGRSAAHESRGSGRAIDIGRDLGFDAITEDLRGGVAKQLARVVRRWVLVFCDEESAHLWRAALGSAGLDYVRTGHWHKIGGTPQFTGDRPGVAVEAIVIAHQPGRKRWNGGGRPAIWPCPIVHPITGERVHTTQKPLDLMTALVRDFTDHGETILDPFAGSGTAGVAAIQNGRRFIGWEMDAKYHAVASKRLAEAREQPGLALGRKVRPAKTIDLFGAGHVSNSGNAPDPVKEAAK